MVAPTGSYSPLSLATRLVQAVDAPDPTSAALFAVSETLDSGATAFYAFNPVDSTIVMTHATIGAALSRDAIALHHIEDASVAARTLRDQAPVILPAYAPPDEVRAALTVIGLAPPFNLISFPVTVGSLRFGIIQAVNAAPRYVGVGAPAAIEEIGVLFGAALASARRRTELATLGETIAQVNQSLDLKATLNAILRGLMALVPCVSASIYLDDLAPDALVLVAIRTEGEGERYPTTQPRPLHGSLTGWVYRHRQSVNVPDLFADARVLRSGPDALPPATSVRSYLMLPLMVGDGPVGTLVASRRQTHAFSDDDLRIVERFAPLAAQAVVNARLYTGAETARQRSETLLEDMADAMIRLDRGSIVTGWNKGAERLFGYTAAEALGKNPPLVPLDDEPETAGIWRRVLDNGESFTHIENKQRHKDGRWLDTTVSLSPWRESGEVVGVIAVVRDITSRKELERELAQRVADGARREFDTAFVAAVAQACNSVASGPETLQTLANLTAQWADSASVVTFEEEVRLAAYASRTPEEDEPIRRIIEERAARQPENILEARVVAEKAPRLLDLRRDALAMPLAEAARARAYHTLASVPIRAVGQIVGVLSVAARAETPPLDAQAIATLELVAEQAGLAIARERLNWQVTAQMTTLQRRERDTAYVAAVAQACNSAGDGPAILQALADLTADWADDARVITFEDGEQSLAAYASRTPEADAEIRALLIETYATGVRTMQVVEAARERYEPVIEDLATLPVTPLLSAFLARGYHSKAFMPIRAEGAVAGVLVAGARAETPPFDAQSLTTLELVAEQAGLAITKDRLLRQVSAQVRELEAANRHKDDFLASLSHELRTPLNAILGFGRLIADGLIDDPNERQEAAQDIVASGELLLAQVNDLLDMARVGAGRMAVGSEAVDIADVCRSCERVLSPLITAKRQELVIGVPPETPFVRADAARLTQVVLNLLTNAHKFTTDGGVITVAVIARAERVILTVQDTGIGIAPEHAALIFEPFRRVETGYARSQSGTGLGLALSRRLVELMGGTLTLDSAPGKGSTFTVSLPALPISSLVSSETG
ncbi:MAG: GAF domain-containing protein [Thermomicrobiales bacterium]